MSLQIRKIETEEVREKKSKRNILILSIVMISILVFSIAAGYFAPREKESVISEGKVQGYGDFWIFNYQGKNIRLSSSPESTENVSVTMFTNIKNYFGKTIYVASEYISEFDEVSSALQGYAERIQPACYGACDKNLPEKNCTDTMIVIKPVVGAGFGDGKVYEEENCVFIEGGIVSVDAFLYEIFGMK